MSVTGVTSPASPGRVAVALPTPPPSSTGCAAVPSESWPWQRVPLPVSRNTPCPAAPRRRARRRGASQPASGTVAAGSSKAFREVGRDWEEGERGGERGGRREHGASEGPREEKGGIPRRARSLGGPPGGEGGNSPKEIISLSHCTLRPANGSLCAIVISEPNTGPALAKKLFKNKGKILELLIGSCEPRYTCDGCVLHCCSVCLKKKNWRHKQGKAIVEGRLARHIIGPLECSSGCPRRRCISFCWGGEGPTRFALLGRTSEGGGGWKAGRGGVRQMRVREYDEGEVWGGEARG